MTHISIHPTGKLALTLGADLTLKTWNLIKGRQIFTTNLKSKSSLGRIVDVVEWNPTGQFFILTGAKIIELWDIDTAGVVKEIPCDSRPSCVCWLDDETVLVALNNGKILMFSIHDEEPTIFQMYESSRIKGLAYRDGYLASISSAGDVTVWQVDVEKRTIDEVCSTNLGCRPICVAILDLSAFADDYVLKIEDVEDTETTEIVEHTKKTKPKSSTSQGRVIVEVENGTAAKSRSATVKKTNKNKKSQPSAIADDTNGNGKANKTKADKLGKRKSVSAFIEEDIQSADVTTPIAKKIPRKSVCSTGKAKKKITGGFVESDDITSSSITKKLKNKRLSLA